jgi:hypothetical protein
MFQACVECSDIPPNAQARSRGEAAQGHAEAGRRPHADTARQRMGTPCHGSQALTFLKILMSSWIINSKFLDENVTAACHHFQSVYLQGGSKIQEAHLIFQDFSEKYTVTCMILNGKAQCLMHMGNFIQAEGLLLESLNKVSSSHFS